MFGSPARLVLLGLVVLALACGDNRKVNVDSGVEEIGLTCGPLLLCDQKCQSDDCTNACFGSATAVAQGIFDAFDQCISVTCSSSAGGPCVDASSSACSDCNQTAATGACINWLEQCESDTAMGPPNHNGPVVVPPNSGAIYNCGELVACKAACAATDTECINACITQATPEAGALEAALDSCLAIACPSTPGGPCEMPGLECNGCIEQVELAEPDTCAAPYIACNSDTSNGANSTPTALVSGDALATVLTGLQQAASTIVGAGGFVYYTQVISNEPVSRLAVEGPNAGTVTTLGPPQPTPVSLAVDANNVYVWSVGTFELASSTNNHDATVVQVPLDGGPAITLGDHFEVFYDAAYLNAVAVDAANVYWVAGASGNDGTIMRAPIGGGSGPVAIYSGRYLPQGVVSDGIHVFWVEWGTFDAQGRSNNDGSVWQGSVDGSTMPIQLASSQPAPSGIAIDGTNVYWTDLGPLGGDNLPALNAGFVQMAPIGGGTVTTIAAHQSVPVCIIVSGNRIFWTEYGLNAPGLVMSAPTGGGTVTPLVAGLDDPAALAVFGTTLYWTDANSSPNAGFIMSLSPF